MANSVRLTLQSSQSLSQALGNLESNEAINKLQEKKIKSFEPFAEKLYKLPPITDSDLPELEPAVLLYNRACTALTTEVAQFHDQSWMSFMCWWTEYQNYFGIHMNTLHIVLLKIFR
jgi:hypothetical protein